MTLLPTIKSDFSKFGDGTGRLNLFALSRFFNIISQHKPTDLLVGMKLSTPAVNFVLTSVGQAACGP